MIINQTGKGVNQLIPTTVPNDTTETRKKVAASPFLSTDRYISLHYALISYCPFKSLSCII